MFLTLFLLLILSDHQDNQYQTDERECAVWTVSSQLWKRQFGTRIASEEENTKTIVPTNLSYWPFGFIASSIYDNLGFASVSEVVLELKSWLLACAKLSYKPSIDTSLAVSINYLVLILQMHTRPPAKIRACAQERYTITKQVGFALWLVHATVDSTVQRGFLGLGNSLNVIVSFVQKRSRNSARIAVGLASHTALRHRGTWFVNPVVVAFGPLRSVEALIRNLFAQQTLEHVPIAVEKLFISKVIRSCPTQRDRPAPPGEVTVHQGSRCFGSKRVELHLRHLWPEPVFDCGYRVPDLPVTLAVSNDSTSHCAIVWCRPFSSKQISAPLPFSCTVWFLDEHMTSSVSAMTLQELVTLETV